LRAEDAAKTTVAAEMERVVLWSLVAAKTFETALTDLPATLEQVAVVASSVAETTCKVERVAVAAKDTAEDPIDRAVMRVLLTENVDVVAVSVFAVLRRLVAVITTMEAATVNV